MKTFTFKRSVAFEEGGIESYDYTLEGNPNVIYYSEKSCYIHALENGCEEYFDSGLLNMLDVGQLEDTAIRANIYVNIEDE